MKRTVHLDHDELTQAIYDFASKRDGIIIFGQKKAFFTITPEGDCFLNLGRQQSNPITHEHSIGEQVIENKTCPNCNIALAGEKVIAAQQIRWVCDKCWYAAIEPLTEENTTPDITTPFLSHSGQTTLTLIMPITGERIEIDGIDRTEAAQVKSWLEAVLAKWTDAVATHIKMDIVNAMMKYHAVQSDPKLMRFIVTMPIK